jgi:hypothetical protein
MNLPAMKWFLSCLASTVESLIYRRADAAIIIGVALVFLSSPMSLADRTTLDDTRTQIALPLETAPTIDGVIDADEWTRAGGAAGHFWEVIVDPNLEDGIRGGHPGDNVGNPPASNQDLSFIIYAAYDASNLYVAVRVSDDSIQEDDAAADSANGNTWMDDSVELFLDGDNSNFATRDTSGSNPEVVGTGGQFVITVNNAYREAEAAIRATEKIRLGTPRPPAPTPATRPSSGFRLPLSAIRSRATSLASTSGSTTTMTGARASDRSCGPVCPIPRLLMGTFCWGAVHIARRRRPHLPSTERSTPVNIPGPRKSA